MKTTDREQKAEEKTPQLSAETADQNTDQAETNRTVPAPELLTVFTLCSV
jgi:hypothetical protein